MQQKKILEKMLKIMNFYTLAFFNKYLKGMDSTLLDGDHRLLHASLVGVDLCLEEHGVPDEGNHCYSRQYY